MRFSRNDRWGDEAETAALNAVNMFPWFWCDRCGGGPYRYAHMVDGMKFCADCWLHSLPRRKKE